MSTFGDLSMDALCGLSPRAVAWGREGGREGGREERRDGWRDSGDVCISDTHIYVLWRVSGAFLSIPSHSLRLPCTTQLRVFTTWAPLFVHLNPASHVPSWAPFSVTPPRRIICTTILRHPHACDVSCRCQFPALPPPSCHFSTAISHDAPCSCYPETNHRATSVSDMGL
jgi:hypothetical protein